MRKALFTLVATLICFSFASAAMAGSSLFPRADGNDVLTPDMVIEAIPDQENYNEPIYAACHLNGWLQNLDKIPDQILEATEMTKTENGWVAHDMKGEIFHPTQIQDGEAVPAKLEDVYVNFEALDFIVGPENYPVLKGISILVEE